MDILNIKKIKLLDNNLINKIAAGEVIERPASIVKELVENSIDAGAKNIIIEIKQGGKSYIKIQDDGIGIKKDEIPIAFTRHATSKLETIFDLENILTLGFRGEALASMASIARVEMTTKTKHDQIGNQITIEGGKIISQKEVATLEGTTFIIKDIFFNVPARLKFLKKDASESSYISEIVTKLAFGNPNISFKYINNGSEIISTLGNNDVKNTALYIYGGDIAKMLIPINATKNNFTITGFIGLPEISRGNRNYGNFFINNRYIKSKLVNNAIEEGYSGKLMVSKFPIFIINMTTPENSVDINVHPTKLEARFEDENFIYSFLSEAIKNILNKEVLIPNINISQKNIDTNNIENNNITNDIILEKNQELEPFKEFSTNNPKFKKFEDNNIKNNNIFKKSQDINLDINQDINKNIIAPKNDFIQQSFNSNNSNNNSNNNIKNNIKNNDTQKVVSKNNFFDDYKIIGQIFYTYWIIEQNSEIFLIDQHSAHEKVIYEELYQKFLNSKIHSQALIEPIVLQVSTIEKNTIIENLDLLEKFGFNIEDFGNECYAISKVPFIFKNALSPSSFMEILDSLVDNDFKNNTNKSIYDIKIEKIISMSCKKAVKANDKLSHIEAEALIDKLLIIEEPFTCPHGRPTIVKITKNEIEKFFKRT